MRQKSNYDEMEKEKKINIWLWISALVNSDQSGLVGTEQKNSSAAWSPMSFYIGINWLLSRLYRETFVGLLLLCQPQGLKCRGLKVASDMEGSTYFQHQLKNTKKGKVRLPTQSILYRDTVLGCSQRLALRLRRSPWLMIFIGPRSDHSLPMSVTNWLTDWRPCWRLNELT